VIEVTMPDLVESTPEATIWMARMLEAHENKSVFGQIRSAVIWTDDAGADGEMLLALDPVALAAKINDEPYPLQVSHDPGRPMGMMLTAKSFTRS
jgi:hypothetical protein